MSNQLKTRIKDRLQALGLSPRAASLRVGTNADMIRGLIRDDIEPNPTTDTVNKVAAALEVSAEWLLGLDETEPPVIPPSGKSEVSLANLELPPRHALAQDVPVLGTARGSVINDFQGFTLENNIVEYARRPPALVGVKDLYSIFVEGESMFPAHPEGEMRFVHPHRPCKIGDTVVVQTRRHDDDPGQAYIKVLKRRSASVVVLEQYSPPAIIEMPVEYILSIHKVLTINELFGV